MPEMWLSDDPARVQQAVELLQAALVAPAGKRRKVTITEANDSDEPTDPQKAGYAWIERVLSEDGYIVIVPLQRLEIYLPTTRVKSGSGKSYQTYIDHNGDFVNIAVPYIMQGNPGKVLGRKRSIHILRDEDA